MTMLRSLATLAIALPMASAWWRDLPPMERGEPPYPFPANRQYNPANEKTGPDPSKINVHLVPHTHDDTGWQVTVDQYFQNEVYYVVDTVVDQLLKDPNRHFIYVEIGFFARWWDEQPEARQNATKALVANGQLEFINGGWCMHDEASPYYVEMVDQTTRGHQFIVKNFGRSAAPRGTWQIDPFGHSNTEAWLLGAEAGMESLYWGRTDYQDMAWRTNWKGQQANQWPQWVWQGSQSIGKDAQVLAGQLGTGGYGTHIGWDNTGGAVQDNPARHDYNLDEMVDAFITAAIQQQNTTKTIHQMWACGSDFQYQNADHWFHNLDKIIHYVNVNASMGGPVKAFYSTPSHYTDSVATETKAKGLVWEVRSDDVFPLANAPHAYWSGYFTSRPALKRQVRFGSNFLNAARQMEVLSGITADQVKTPTTRPAPPVGSSWTDSLEGTIGVATHHDGMSGTERQSVADDYEQRISESHFEVEAGVALALQKLGGFSSPLGHCNCNEAGNCLNMSVCAFTTGVDEFSVVAWNPQGQTASPWLRIPVSGQAGWTVTDDSTGKPVPSQVIQLDNRTLGIPLLYINYFGMKPAAAAAAEAAYANKATHTLTFSGAIPAVGFKVFTVKKAISGRTARSAVAHIAKPNVQASSVSNGVYEVTFDQAAGTITGITNLKSGVKSTLDLNWGFYVSSEGGKTYLANGTAMDSQQASGAYLFRPINQTTTPVSSKGPTLTITQGPLVTEITQTFASWATHVVRLTNGSKYIEVEWTAGPIPNDYVSLPPKPAPGGCVGWIQTTKCNAHGTPDPEKPPASCTQPLKPRGDSGYCKCGKGVDIYGVGCGGPTKRDGSGELYPTCEAACAAPIPQFEPAPGRELVLKFGSNLKSKGVFYTDSNGREMVKRVRDGRGPSYPPLEVNEPVAGNYYPVNSMIALDDGANEMAVVTDVSMGGASMNDGELEIMVHRRVMHDDHRGVQEPLNETMCGCNDIGAAPGSMGAHGHEGDGGCACAGLTMRGVAYLILDTVENSHADRRQLIEQLNFMPTLAFSSGAAKPSTASWSALSAELPANVKLLTVMNNYAEFNGGQLLLRLAHMYSVDEHPTLSLPVTVSLSAVFGKAGFKVTNAEEMTLTGNQPRAAFEARRITWPTEDPTGRMYKSENAYEHRIPYNTETTEITLRPMDVRTFLVTVA